MKNIVIVSCLVLALAVSCASVAPETKVDWALVNASDADGLRSGTIKLAPGEVFFACVETLKSEGWEIESADTENKTVTTARKHGVTFYGVADYAMSCRVSGTAEASDLSWTVISYVTKNITNVDPLTASGAEKWNFKVYQRLAEKGAIKREARPEPAAEKAPESADTPVNDDGLPPPPREE